MAAQLMDRMDLRPVANIAELEPFDECDGGQLREAKERLGDSEKRFDLLGQRVFEKKLSDRTFDQVCLSGILNAPARRDASTSQTHHTTSRNIDFMRKDEGGRPVREPHQVHMAIKIEKLAQNDRHLLKPAAA
jgi:hypothetical protein